MAVALGLASGGPAPGLATLLAMPWRVAYDGNRATYGSGLLTGFPARIAPAGVTPTLVPTGGDNTKPLAPLVTMGQLTGPFFRTSLASTAPSWGKASYAEFAGTVDGASLTEMTRQVIGYANLDLPTGISERQELFGCNVAGGSAEPTNLLGYPGTLQTKISEYNGGATAWKPSTTAPESRFFSITEVFKSNGDVDLYFNGQLVDTIVGGWTPGVQLVNLFMGAAWHSGTTTLSAPFDGHIFFAAYATKAFSAAEVAKCQAHAFIAAGRDVTADWWPNDDASTAQFLDLGGRLLLEYSLDTTTQRVVSWQSRDASARAHTTGSEASRPGRGLLAADLIGQRESAVFDGVDDVLVGGSGAFPFDGAQEYVGGFIMRPGTITDTSANGYQGHTIWGETNGVRAVNLWLSSGQAKARLFNWQDGDIGGGKQVSVDVTSGLDTWIEYWRTGGNIFIRAVDSNGKRLAGPVAAGTYSGAFGNWQYGKGYASSSFCSMRMSRHVHRAGYDATYQTKLRAWASREIGFDCT